MALGSLLCNLYLDVESMKSGRSDVAPLDKNEANPRTSQDEVIQHVIGMTSAVSCTLDGESVWQYLACFEALALAARYASAVLSMNSIENWRASHLTVRNRTKVPSSDRKDPVLYTGTSTCCHSCLISIAREARTRSRNEASLSPLRFTVAVCKLSRKASSTFTCHRDTLLARCLASPADSLCQHG